MATDLRKRKIVPKVVAAPVPVPEAKQRVKKIRAYEYRGVQFVAMAKEDNPQHVRLYTAPNRSTPEYQCTVLLKNERKAVYALAKLLLAESELAELAVPDEVESA